MVGAVKGHLTIKMIKMKKNEQKASEAKAAISESVVGVRIAMLYFLSRPSF